MPLTQGHNKKYTYAEYLTWQDDERWELIDGEAYDMTPAPTTTHQRIAARLYSRLEAALNAKPCTPFIAPTDVVLSHHDVVQPDVLVVWDEKQITRENIRGNPDLIVGVLSPAPVRNDRRENALRGADDEMLRSCRSGILPRWWAVAAGSSSCNKTGSNLKAQLLNRNEYIEKNRLKQQVMGAKDAADS